METLTETHPVVQKIQDSTAIDDETRFTALAELAALEQRRSELSDVRPGYPAFSDDAEDIDDLFLWEESALGVQFWMHIQDEIFEADKRSC